MSSVLLITLLVLGAIRLVVAPFAVDVVETTARAIMRRIDRHRGNP